MPLNLEHAIIKTVVYADIFNYPLTIEETGKWLIGERANQKEVGKAVRILINDKKIELKGSYIFIPGKSELISLRLKKNYWSKKKMDKLAGMLFILRKIPFINMIGITGTLSMENADNNDDIDLLVVTKKKRLWLTRLIITILLELKGVRRHPGKMIAKDKICINMFLDEDHLALLIPERDVFSAHELLQMKPILERDAVYFRFISNNKWAEKYLPNAFSEIIMKMQTNASKETNGVAILLNNMFRRIIDCLEILFKWLQMRYMRNKMSEEVISNGYVRFHPHDLRTTVLSSYKQKLELFRLNP